MKLAPASEYIPILLNWRVYSNCRFHFDAVVGGPDIDRRYSSGRPELLACLVS